MILVRMKRAWRSWNPGETAGFTPDVAARLVRDGIADEVSPAASEAPEPRGPAHKAHKAKKTP